MSSKVEKIGRGVKAECVYEPLGLSGLEGFQLNKRYRAQQMSINNRKYWRLWPVFGNDYYETCGLVAFSRHFKIIKTRVKDVQQT